MNYPLFAVARMFIQINGSILNNLLSLGCTDLMACQVAYIFVVPIEQNHNL